MANTNTNIMPGSVSPSCVSVDNFASDVLAGLSRKDKRIPSVYFYDDAGSELFCRITQLEEYYPTRCEIEILKSYRWALARMFSREPFNLIELGVGEGIKPLILLEQFLSGGLDFKYIPVDICTESVQKTIKAVNTEFDGYNLEVKGMVADYFEAMRLICSEKGRKNVVMFLGSNIGNFEKDESRGFLSQLSGSLRSGDYALIGFDLKKDIRLLERAYNDSAGITREFNLNLLNRMNRELGANFDRAKFEHLGCYNDRLGAMESWLISLNDQIVHIGHSGTRFHFRKGEKILTEYSHKYSVSDIKGLADGSGFSVARLFFDSRRYFTDALWRVK
ncbi:MAG TPA: L-histidine N(alpha)-methyltransferase [Nitrospirota bacterium]|jgi:dimethylhistidine N-methyltransferase